ncbi:MAG: hypothetical protein Q4G68_00270 [Planctomycetia bacterium]|nr:hypothetical protein [Planctomycetia bacterium]
MYKNIVTLMIVFVSIVVFTGCIKQKEPTGSITGMVTYKGQSVTNGEISFRGSERGKGGGCPIAEDGTYSINAIPTGDYSIVLLPPPKGMPGTPEERKPINYIVPEKYQKFETSNLTFTIKEGKNTFDLNLK